MGVIEHIAKIGSVPHQYGDRLSAECVFAVALTHVQLEETDSIPTACVEPRNDKFVIKINPKFVEETCQGWPETDKIAFVRGLGKHELLHAMLKHTVPVPGFNPKLANIVQDALINTIIPEFKALIKKGLLKPVEPERILESKGDILFASDTALRNDWTWEEYYNAIRKTFDDENFESKSAQKIKKLSEDVKPGETNVQVQEELNATLDRLVSAMKSQGAVPGWLERRVELDRKLEMRLRIRKEMIRLVREGTEKIKLTTATRPNRRFEHAFGTRNFYFAPKILALIDVSGSISEPELKWAVGELSAIARSLGAKFKVYTYDTELRAKMTYREIQRDGFRSKGGGGTSLKKALRELPEEELNGAFVFVFTDGYDTCPSESDFKGARQIVYMLHENHDKSFELKAREYATVFEIGG